MSVRPVSARRALVPVALAALTLVLALTTASAASAKTVWLCKPGLKHNPCLGSRTTTVLKADGSTTVEKSPTPKKTPPIDCFYVYPTVSGQPGAVANRHIDAEQTAIARQQASRFAPLCRVYAPVYRQLTLNGIAGTPPTPAQAAQGPADVLAAWKDYLKHDNHGRGVVLVGHSQGAFELKALVAAQIDRSALLRKRLVSAILLGGNVTVKPGGDVGGDFRHVPACRKTGQTGCVIAYSSFDKQPPPTAVFGRAGTGFGSAAGSALQVLCTNPAALAGGTGALKPYVLAQRFPGTLGLAINVVPDVPTPWASEPGLYTAQCQTSEGATWLQIDHAAGDPRPVFQPTIGDDWGLHLGDVNLAWGNLVDDVRAQSKAYVAAGG